MSRRVAMISEHASPLGCLGGVDSGGQNVYVAQVAKHLAAFGYQVDVFTRRDDPTLPEVVACSPNVRVVHVPAGPARFVPKEELLGFMDEFRREMIRFCDQQAMEYELIHAHFWMSGLVAAEIKCRRRIPFVMTFHALGRVRRLYQGDADRFPAERISIEHRLVDEADRLIAECPQDQEDQINLYGASPEKIRLVPCGFDKSELWPVGKSKARRHLALDSCEPIVLHVGRMVPRKGVDNAIRGFARLVMKHGVGARMVIVGGESDDPDPALTPEIGRLRQIAAEEGIADRVRFVGRRGRADLKYYYSAADVFVTTPWYEPFGITPIEAMACGVPVIGANVGGIKYGVRHGVTGYLVPPNDPDALGEQLAHLLQQPRLLGRFSLNAIERVNRLFTWRRVSAQIAEVYEELIGRGISRAPASSPIAVAADVYRAAAGG
ncbi:MAG TPA: glycosyltransferase family 1 protein [Pirellulales bacterium]|nr:glycosyltransferase family 1 protein [Pirellulales bacterium]